MIAPSQRIIDSRVVMSLLGATTVQLGAAIYTIARAIFAQPGAKRLSALDRRSLPG